MDLFENENFEGRQVTATCSTPGLADFNDKTSSIIIHGI